MLNAIRTDLRLLLECLKCQMKCPVSQKQALLTMVSICHQNSQNVEFLGEIGGVTFIYNLSRASDYSEVKETALFTLSSLAEFNESCKQNLCTQEMFCGLADCMEQDVSLTMKRVAVYMLCVLVSNNKQGQSLAMSSRCIDLLLNLFRCTYPMNDGTDELLPLWTSVSSALCGCVNNPQNEENQRACMSVLPLVKVWLQQVSTVRTELAQPICSFISMTVANNSFVQEYFASVGGLLTLSDTLSRAVSQCSENPTACLLATMITRTLSACIADNEAVALLLSKLSLVPDLLLLLSSPNLSPREQLAVVLTLGHCTDACVEHQSQLLQGGGLPLMISLLTDSNDEEVRKAATFVLQTCKKLTGSIAGQSAESDLQGHRQAAWEMRQRIQQLERRQMDDSETENRKESGLSRGHEEESGTVPVLGLRNQLPLQHVRRQIVKGIDKSVSPFHEGRRDDQQPSESVMRRITAERDLQTKRKSAMKNSGVEELERGETDGTNLNADRWIDDLENDNLDTVSHTKPPAENRNARTSDSFKHPAKRRQQARFGSEDELSVCAELLDIEIKRILITPAAPKPREIRCTGCVSGLDEVNSRSMGVVLRSCESRCEFHRVLQRAEDRLKRSLRLDGVTHTRGHDHMQKTDTRPDSNHQGAVMERKVHRDRKDYSHDELKYLSDGVRRFGHSWNTILWAYPFQQGRTNVDLAKKYRNLLQGSRPSPDLLPQEPAGQKAHSRDKTVCKV